MACEIQLLVHSDEFAIFDFKAQFVAVDQGHDPPVTIRKSAAFDIDVFDHTDHADDRSRVVAALDDLEDETDAEPHQQLQALVRYLREAGWQVAGARQHWWDILLDPAPVVVVNPTPAPAPTPTRAG